MFENGPSCVQVMVVDAWVVQIPPDMSSTLYTAFRFCKWLLLCMVYTTLVQAQTTNFQNVVTKCYNGFSPPINGSFGSSIGFINFTSADVPTGHRISDIIVEVAWSYTNDGSCGPTSANPTDLSRVGFGILGPVGTVRYLATSAITSGSGTIATTASFSGNGNIISDTIVFKQGAASLLPATLPILGRDTVTPNADPLGFYYGAAPLGTWRLIATNDAAPGNPSLCVHSYCITLITCAVDELLVSCKQQVDLPLSNTGTHNLSFLDLDSISDVSCRIKNISFTPSTLTCADVNLPRPATMTITDCLDSTSSCISMVTARDTTAPTIMGCAPMIFKTLYLDEMGRDTFWADSILVMDNCSSGGALIREVRPFVGSRPWASSLVFNCQPGLKQFRVRVTDQSGNVGHCLYFVNVVDTVIPTAVCGRHTAYLTNASNGAVTVDAILLDGGSFDVCPPIVSAWIGNQFDPPPVYTCADIGMDTVRLVVADQSGNIHACDSAIITIVDTIPPVAICHPDTLYLDVNGQAKLYPSDIDGGSSDICSVLLNNINGMDSLMFNCSHINAPQPVQLNVSDPSGNWASCMTMVLILDTFPPVASCQDDSVFIAPNGVALVTIGLIDAGSVDLCTGNNITMSIGGGASVGLGCSDIVNNPNQVTLTVMDSFSNTSTCVSNITVIDTIRPTVVCNNPTIQLNNTGAATLYATDLDGGSTDNCNVIQDSFVNTVGTRFITFGCNALFVPQIVTLIVTDEGGNSASCAATVTVEDNVAPTAICRSHHTAALDATGIATVVPADIDSNSTDNCGITTYLINNSSQIQYTCVDLGGQTATLLVTDSSGNQQTCATQIDVVDNFSPTVSCQPIVRSLSNTGAVTVVPNELVSSVGDNCGTTTIAFTTGNSITYNCDSLGSRIVELVVTDNFGNITQCLTTVTVTDTTAPQASCRPVPYTVQLDSSGQGFITGTDVDNGSSDLCGVARLLVNGADSVSFACGQIGNTQVTLTVIDSSGNPSNCLARVVVNDPIPPVANCRDTLLYLSNSGTATIAAVALDAGSVDNCGYTVSINGAASTTFGCSQIGINTVPISIEDGSGNITQCASRVTIADTSRPVAICVGTGTVTLYLDSSCVTSAPAALFNSGSTDGCGANGLTYSINGLPNVFFNATSLSTNPNTITLTVEDASGNQATCTTTVLVEDTIAPTALCQPDTLQLLGATVVLDPLQINAGSLDNCSATSLTINGHPSITFDCSNLGSNVVTLQAYDISGNVDVCQTTVFVEDVAVPDARCAGTVNLFLDSVTNLALLNPNQVNNGSVDNCTITILGLSRDTFDCNDVTNPFPVQLYITDQTGNTDSCTSQIIVEDAIAPVAVCQSDTLYFAGVPVVLNPLAIDAGSSDNCTLVNYALSQDTFACPDIGLTTISLTVTDQNGNTATCPADVLLLDTIATADAGLEQILCGGQDSTVLNANTPSALLTGTWVANTSATISNLNDPNATLTNLAIGDNVFHWVISNATCSRLSEDSVVIRVEALSTDSAYAGVDTALCNQTNTFLQANPTTNSIGRWLQSSIQSNAQVVIADTTDPNTSVSGLVPGNSYIFVWELVNGRCGAYDTDTVIVLVDELPNDIADAGSNITCSPDSVVLTGSAPMLGTVQWMNTEGASIRNPQSVATWVTNFSQDTSTFIYSLSNGACLNYSVDTVYVILDDEHPILRADSFNIVPNGLPSRLNVITNDVLPPRWQIDLVTAVQTGTVIGLNTGSFEVNVDEAIVTQYFTYAICNRDCPIVCDTAEVSLFIQPPGDCYTPTAFTPNDDGSNDRFLIPCLDNADEKAALYVFNRWGNMVYQTDNYINDWDGTHNNQPLPEGTYFYILQIENKRPQNGSIEIKR